MKTESLNFGRADTASLPDDVYAVTFETQGGVRLSITEDTNGAVTIHGDPIGSDFVGRLMQHEVSISSTQVRIGLLRGVRAGSETPDEALGIIAAETQNAIDHFTRRRDTDGFRVLTGLRDMVLAMRGRK